MTFSRATSVLASAAIAFALISNSCFAFDWKNGKRAAVSFSYDDGFPSQRLKAAAKLQQLGFRGTFYLTPGASGDVQAHIEEWKQLFEVGHEIGNHSMSHFCSVFSSPRNLRQKVWGEVAADVGLAEEWLRVHIFDGKSANHTYAYPCGEYVVGPGDVSGDLSGNPALEQARRVGKCEYGALISKVVRLARTADGLNNDPELVTQNRYFVMGHSISDENDNKAVEDAKAAIDAGIAAGQWTVLIFHEIIDEGGTLHTTPAHHDEILRYVESRKHDLWVDTIYNVGAFILNKNPSPKWTCE